MTSFDFNKYKNAWVSGKDFAEPKLSQSQIRRFLTKESNDMTRLFRRNIFFDIFLKSVVILYWIGLMLVFSFHGVCALVLSLSLLSIIFELSLIRKIPYIDYAKESLQNILKLKSDFLRFCLLKVVFAKGITAPLIIISGMAGWFLFRYGEIRVFDFEDFIVLCGFVMIGFALNAFVEFKQLVYQINQLEKTINELNNNGLSAYYIEKQKRMRWRRFLMLVFATVCGLLLLGAVAFL